MPKSALARFLVLPLALFTLLCFACLPTVSAKSVEPQGIIHGSGFLKGPHTVVASFPATIKVQSNGVVRPMAAFCNYIVYQPFVALVNGANYIIAEGGFTCNNYFSEAQAMITLNGPTTSSGEYYDYLDTCYNQTSCEGYLGVPYISGGTWQTWINGGGAGVGFGGQGYSPWVSL